VVLFYTIFLIYFGITTLENILINNYLINGGVSGFDEVIEEDSAGSRDDLKNQQSDNCQ
jgi:hypothetical protein